mmetsp:Transcript_52386/g.156334  ORF Transcript_52386/g.156334 Transcript_52386/m.156334 type:complete len:296 (-) Transcript_52386:239-1126(-)
MRSRLRRHRRQAATADAIGLARMAAATVLVPAAARPESAARSDLLVLAVVVVARVELQELLVRPVAEGLAGEREGRRDGQEELAVDHRGVVAEAVELRARGPGDAVLEEEGDDGEHRQPAVGDLGVQLASALRRVRDGAEQAARAQVAEAVVARLLLVLDEPALHHAGEDDDLGPSQQRHLGERAEAVGHVGELDAQGGREVAREAEVLRQDVADCGQHGDAAVLDLHGAAALEGLGIAVLAEFKGIPEASGGLDANLALEGRDGHLRRTPAPAPPQGRCGHNRARKPEAQEGPG